VRSISAQLEHALGEFRVPAWPAGAVPVTGTLWPYEQSHVLRHMSQAARRVANNGDLMELYEEDERFWLVDDRWGIAEMNLLKGQWRSWILPNAQMDTVRCVQMAVLWPMAQLLRARGLYVVPSASVSLAGKTFLILSPFGIEAELSALIRGGYRVIGQSWTAIREESGRFLLLHLPGHIERSVPPGMRMSAEPVQTWVDLMAENINAEQRQGWCDAILVVDTGRRPQASLRPLDRVRAVQVLRSAWPIFELHPNRRHGQLPARLAQKVPCYQLHLSRQPKDLLKMLATMPIPITEASVRGQGMRVAV
jgi:hypothetical protein